MDNNLDDILLQIAQQYGYLGVFTVSLLGSLIPFLPVPYLFIVVLLSEALDPLILGLASGLGGSLGKVTSYALGRGGYRLFSQERKRKMDTLRGLIGRYGDLGVFIFALTPLPDDVYLIPIGMMRFSFWRFLIANTLGKIILSISVAYAGRTYFDAASLLLGEGAQLPATAAAITAMIIITVILLRVDWEVTVKILKDQGVIGVIRNLGLILNLGKKNK
ncbi:MAG TPA: DedA family protein [Candidatus Caldiarchaeum subterraneum]|uniref:DedA family protein n=1 Tax=Caldiarchaeum subterraneum TaxID=311458 RepID=A0A833EAH0_CALS0|nr:DedA family protein [Candidatus Caldarchaeum subterraneum]